MDRPWRLSQYVRQMQLGNEERDEGAGSSNPLVKEHLFAARTVLIFGEVTSNLAESVCSQLLALDERGNELIRIVLHSQGGHVEAGDTIHDMIRFVRSPVQILGSGWVASAGALIFCAAQLENRLSLPNTRFLLHQPLGGVSGQASDVEIEAAQIIRMKKRLNAIFAKATGQTLERITTDTDRNHWMSAEEAVDYGLVGAVVHHRPARNG